MLESDVRKDFAKRWIGWLDTYEPRRGSTIGAPDTQILVRGILRPVEFKVGEIVAGRVMPYVVRPAQVSWHTRLANAGGKSWFIVGIERNGIIVHLAAEATKLLNGRHHGLILGTHCWHIKTGMMTAKLGDAIFSDNICQFILSS